MRPSERIEVFTGKFYIFLCCCVLFGHVIFAQQASEDKIKIKGVVIAMEDGASLSGVNVYSKRSRVGRVSNNKGYFELTVLKSDTLIFSYVGYETIHLSVADFTDDPADIVVPMRESVIQLPDITIEDSYPQVEYLMRHKPIQLKAFESQNKGPDVDVPVGSLDYGPLSYFSKEAKEKRILMRNYAKEQVNKVYVHTVNSDSLRNQFMDMYGLNRNEFDKFIIYFNTHPPAMNQQDAADIARAMHEAFRTYRKQKE